MITTKTCAFFFSRKSFTQKCDIHKTNFHFVSVTWVWFSQLVYCLKKIVKLTSWSLPLFLKFCKRFTFGSTDVIFPFFSFAVEVIQVFFVEFYMLYWIISICVLLKTYTSISLNYFLRILNVKFIFLSRYQKNHWLNGIRRKNDTATATTNERTNSERMNETNDMDKAE